LGFSFYNPSLSIAVLTINFLICVNIIDNTLFHIKNLSHNFYFLQEAQLKIRGLSLIFIFSYYLVISPLSILNGQQAAKRIAVLELMGQGISQAGAQTLTERLRSRLVNTKAFHVLEREQMDEVLKEQGFQQSGCVSDECLVEIGRLVGVEQMVGGSIGKIGQTYTLDLRIIDVSSGRIVKTVSHDYRGDADGLLEVLETAAREIAGEKVQKDGGTSWYYWLGAGLLLAGGAIFLLGGDSSSKGGGGSDLPGIDGLNWPPQQ
jgi:TolB-like protein